MRRRVAVVGTLGGGLFVARRHAEGQRRPHDCACDASDLTSAMASVHERGLAVVPHFMPPAELRAIRETPAFRSMPTSSLVPSDETWRTSALGRYHRIHFSDDDLDAFGAVEARLRPYVARFFGFGVDLLADGVARGSEGSQYVVRSELQLLNAAPASHSQSWHSDHQARGLTLVVPLVEFTPANGATQLLPGSHAPSRAWRWLLGGAQVVAAPAGSLLVYDARTYHRGLGNDTDASRPALVFRYDRADERPPPGVGLVGSLLHAAVAATLHLLTAAVATARDQASGALGSGGVDSGCARTRAAER